MTEFAFRKATKRQARLRLAITGQASGGKTWTALTFARVLAGPEGRVAVIDTERGSASKYAHRFDFDSLDLTPPYTPERYIEAIRAAEAAGYDVLVIDSASHEWNGSGGCLEANDTLAKVKYRGNSWSAWSETTPRHHAFVDAMLQTSLHVIATFRSKMETVQNEEGGRKKVEKIGLAPVTREGVEYEFDIVLDMLDRDNNAAVSKSRCDLVEQGSVTRKPGADFMAVVKRWLDDGAPAEPAAPTLSVVRGDLPEGVTIERLAELLIALPSKSDKARLMTAHHIGVLNQRPDFTNATEIVKLAAALLATAPAAEPEAAPAETPPAADPAPAETATPEPAREVSGGAAPAIVGALMAMTLGARSKAVAAAGSVVTGRSLSTREGLTAWVEALDSDAIGRLTTAINLP